MSYDVGGHASELNSKAGENQGMRKRFLLETGDDADNEESGENEHAMSDIEESGENERAEEPDILLRQARGRAGQILGVSVVG